MPEGEGRREPGESGEERKPVVGFVTFHVDGDRIGLVFSGVGLPIPESLEPTMTIYYDRKRHRIRVRPGIKAKKENVADSEDPRRVYKGEEAGEEGERGEGEESPLCYLPDELRGALCAAEHPTLRVPLSLPDLSAFITTTPRGIPRLLTFPEYKHRVKTGIPLWDPAPKGLLRMRQGPYVRPRQHQPKLLPLTRAMFNRLIEIVRYRMLCGTLP